MSAPAATQLARPGPIMQSLRHSPARPISGHAARNVNRRHTWLGKGVHVRKGRRRPRDPQGRGAGNGHQAVGGSRSNPGSPTSATQTGQEHPRSGGRGDLAPPPQAGINPPPQRRGIPAPTTWGQLPSPPARRSADARRYPDSGSRPAMPPFPGQELTHPTLTWGSLITHPQIHRSPHSGQHSALPLNPKAPALRLPPPPTHTPQHPELAA